MSTILKVAHNIHHLAIARNAESLRMSLPSAAIAMLVTMVLGVAGYVVRHPS